MAWKWGDPNLLPPTYPQALVLMGIISPLGFRRPMPIAITLASVGWLCQHLGLKTPENTKTWNSKQSLTHPVNNEINYLSLNWWVKTDFWNINSTIQERDKLGNIKMIPPWNWPSHLQNGWLEDDPFLLGLPIFQGLCLLIFRQGINGNVPIFMMIPNLYIKTMLFYIWFPSILNWWALGVSQKHLKNTPRKKIKVEPYEITHWNKENRIWTKPPCRTWEHANLQGLPAIQKGQNRIPTIQFQGRTVSFREGRSTINKSINLREQRSKPLWHSTILIGL